MTNPKETDPETEKRVRKNIDGEFDEFDPIAALARLDELEKNEQDWQSVIQNPE